MINYEVLRFIHIAIPYTINTFSVVVGILIANFFWKSRIHRYAKTEVVETLEYQKNKIIELEGVIKVKSRKIVDLESNMKSANVSALKILGVTK